MTSAFPIEPMPWLLDLSTEDLRRSVDALYRVHKLIWVISDLDTLLEAIMEESKAVAQAEACSLLLLDPKTNELYFHVTLGESGNPDALKEVRLPVGEGIAGACAAERRSINVEDVRTDKRFFPKVDEQSQFETRSLLAVPLVAHEAISRESTGLVGVIEVLNKQGGGSFSEADLHLMEMFSSVAGTAIARARLIEENLEAARLAAIGQAVAGLSHYTKNLLTGMGGSVDLIDQGLAEHKLDMLQRSWPILKRSTRRITNFVEDMLAYSKERSPVRERCDLQAIFDEVYDTYASLLIRRDVDYVVTVEPDAKFVLLDARGIHRVLLNLVTNAADAVPQENGSIHVRAFPSAENPLDLVVEVTDNGAGVPGEIRQQIFEPFFSTKGSHGTGLGLAVTAKIVREHSGVIEVLDSPHPEGGAVFRIVLPEAITT